MKLRLADNFSITNLPEEYSKTHSIEIREASHPPSHNHLIAQVESYVDNEIIARLLSPIINIGVHPRKAIMQLLPYEVYWIAQYSGPALQEDTVELPENGKFRWFIVRLIPHTVIK